MDALMLEMKKLLASDRKDCNVQEIIGESAEKSIDELLIEADRIIDETLPYFQASLNTNGVKKSNDFKHLKVNTEVISTLQNSIKRIDFNTNIKVSQKHSKSSSIHGKLTTHKYTENEGIKKKQICSSSTNHMETSFKVPQCTRLHVSSALLENHNRLRILCDKHDTYDELANSIETQDQIDKLKMEEELNYYKIKNCELEKNIKNNEQKIRDWEKKYQQLNQDFCNKFSKKNIDRLLENYERQLNELIEHNVRRESQLRNIINYLLKEIDQSHLQYRIKLSKKNKQVRKYLDQIEIILSNVYEFRNNNTKLLH